MEPQPFLSVSCLPVPEDIVSFRLAIYKQTGSSVGNFLMRAGGLLLAAAGVLLFVWRGGGLFDRAAWCLLLLFGLFLASYRDVLAPYLIRVSVKNEFTQGRRLDVAFSFEFYDDHLNIHSDRYDAHLPYEFLYRVVEDKRQFLLYVGEDETWFLPKRVLEEADAARLGEFLKKKHREAQ